MFRTRLVCPHQQDHMTYASKHFVTKLYQANTMLAVLFLAVIRDAFAGPAKCLASTTAPASGRLQPSLVSRSSLALSFPSASHMSVANGATAIWGVHLCKIYLSHSTKLCCPSDLEQPSQCALIIITVQVMAGPSVHLLRHGPDADSWHGLSYAQLAEYAGHTDILSAHRRGPCSL